MMNDVIDIEEARRRRLEQSINRSICDTYNVLYGISHNDGHLIGEIQDTNYYPLPWSNDDDTADY